MASIYEVVVADNASTDETRAILSEFQGRIEVISSQRNAGFAAGQNLAIQACTGADWVLTLNPDVLLEPGFVRNLLDAGSADPTVGAVCGKLLSIAPGFEPLAEPRIDSAGIYFTPNMRHFDRGWHQPDSRRYDCAEYVFGASAAAALYRREMIDDIAVDGDFFDPDFFVYREDADVAWRAQLMGWRCLYEPSAVAHHVRTVTPANRRTLPGFINMHSVKNRFLMRIKNADAGPLPALLAAHDAARSDGDGRLDVLGTKLAASILASRKMPAPRCEATPPDHGAAAGQRRGTDRPLRPSAGNAARSGASECRSKSRRRRSRAPCYTRQPNRPPDPTDPPESCPRAAQPTERPWAPRFAVTSTFSNSLSGKTHERPGGNTLDSSSLVIVLTVALD